MNVCNNEYMDKRTIAFNSLETHPWLNRVFKKLNRDDLYICRQFLAEKEHLSKGDFELAVNRMFIDKENKPKNWKLICELLTCANSAL